jgi:glutamate-1-semialdehyde 2,1-aminomutase
MDIIDEYVHSHPLSRQLHQRAMNHFAAGGVTHVGRIWEPFGPYMTHARGSRMWDVDGHEYIEFRNGHGALILGHCHPAIVEAIQEQLTRGILYSASHELEIEWAELIKGMVPAAERVEFFACGQEANMMGIRVARAFTGRTKVLKFEENFHGWADELVAPRGLGVVNAEMRVIPANDLGLLEEELATGQFAIVLTEGGGAHMAGQVPWETDFIRALGPAARRYGTLWLVDEVVTGFRDGSAGWTGLMALTPDLITLGKCVAGGMPAGVLTGRADVMGMLTPRPPTEGWIRHSGTWNAMPVVCAAGIAACKLLKDGRVQRQVNETGAYMRRVGNEALRRSGYNWRLYGRSIIHVYFGEVDCEVDDAGSPPTPDSRRLLAGAKEKHKLGVYLLQHGIHSQQGRMFILSIAHTRDDIDRTVAALVRSIGEAMAEGVIGELPRVG